MDFKTFTVAPAVFEGHFRTKKRLLEVMGSVEGRRAEKSRDIIILDKRISFG